MAKVVKVDISGLEKTQKDLSVAKRLTLGRLGELGYQSLRHAIKGLAYKTGNLWQGVAPAEIDEATGRATLTVSARSGARGARTATVHYPGGKTKQIMLRGEQPFNYAEVVAHGRPALHPRQAEAMLIPVQSVSAGETYISDGSQLFVVRRSAKAFKGTHFDDIAAEEIQERAPAVVGKVFEELFA